MSQPPLNPQDVRSKAALALEAGRVMINRSYLAQLQQYPVQPFVQGVSPFQRATDLRLFRIERIVQGNKQSVLESTTAAYTALGAAGYSVFLYLRSDGCETALYIGTRGEPGKALGQGSGELLQETFKGHFSGSALAPLDAGSTNSVLDGLLAEKANPASSVTAVTGVPALSTDSREHFMQGLERFIDAAERRVYQALILAEPVSSHSLDQIRIGYEQVATQLSPLQKVSMSFGVQESDSVGLSISQSLSESLGDSLAMTETRGHASTVGTSTSTTEGSSQTRSSQNTMGKIAGIAAPLLGSALGSVLGPPGAMIGAQLGSAATSALSEQHSTGTSRSRTEGHSESHSTSSGESVGATKSTTSSSGTTDGWSSTQMTGTQRQTSIEITDKSITQLLDKIDHHLARIDEAKTYGGWNAAAYFIGDSTASSEALASIFLGLIRGTDSSHEDFALTTWNSDTKTAVLDWLATLSHPPLENVLSRRLPIANLTPATLVSGKELAIQLSLPRRSTSTVAVVETQAFGRKIQRLDGATNLSAARRTLMLGQIRHLWENLPQTINLDLDQLASHVFISGSTGAGKSNTIYTILHQLQAAGVPFLVIEPAKGEYKHVFGHRPGVQVFGTNPALSKLLKINPFAFPSAIHLLEHVDRLIEIFNVCWPMYAAMPAVLKDAILQAYESCGWNLESSQNRYGRLLFPSFKDLLASIEDVIAGSAYSTEVKGNYLGSLSTRIKSLSNGLNGQIFTADELDNAVLFDHCTIVDLSRIGSAETKTLLMGILVMRLSEHRMAQGGMNRPLQHVTILEEAHHLLRRNGGDSGAEGSSLAAKSTEMLTNAIAEMRTYGEGFLIVDQSPNAVDLAAIRNTNTKIIMRLPDEMDRRLIGKSAAMRDEQLDEIARLPQGVAIVYQNDWMEPVLCQVRKFNGEQRPYHYQHQPASASGNLRFRRQLMYLLLAHRTQSPACPKLSMLESELQSQPWPSRTKIALLEVIWACQRGEQPGLLREQNFAWLAQLISELLECRKRVAQLIQQAQDYAELHAMLEAVVANYVAGLNPSLCTAAIHCLMKDYSVQHTSNLEIYAAWHANFETRNVE